MRLPSFKVFRNGNNTQGKLRMNLHSMSESLSKLLECERKSLSWFCIKSKSKNAETSKEKTK